MNYWARKEELKRKARTHTKTMEYNYPKEIRECINNTKVFGQCSEPKWRIKKVPDIKIIDQTTTDAIFTTAYDLAILNFASYKNPGGMFFEGSSAQEESLCHKSFLYTVLRNFNEFYSWNNAHKNRALYENRALFSPKVIFEDDNGDRRLCDVLTCAAPNWGAADKYCHVSRQENDIILHDRIKFVLDIFFEMGCKNLVLGAYGCGVFKQDPSTVARMFKALLTIQAYDFDSVIFAIPDKNSINYKEFKEVFNNV